MIYDVVDERKMNHYMVAGVEVDTLVSHEEPNHCSTACTKFRKPHYIVSQELEGLFPRDHWKTNILTNHWEVLLQVDGIFSSMPTMVLLRCQKQQGRHYLMILGYPRAIFSSWPLKRLLKHVNSCRAILSRDTTDWMQEIKYSNQLTTFNNKQLMELMSSMWVLQQGIRTTWSIIWRFSEILILEDNMYLEHKKISFHLHIHTRTLKNNL